MNSKPFSTAAAWAQADEARVVNLVVEGMTGLVHATAVSDVLTRVSGVSDVSIDMPRRTVSMTTDSRRLSPEALARVLTEAGYPARPL